MFKKEKKINKQAPPQKKKKKKKEEENINRQNKKTNTAHIVRLQGMFVIDNLLLFSNLHLIMEIKLLIFITISAEVCGWK